VLCIGGMLLADAAGAQTPAQEPPGPWVLDLRGITSPVPDEAAFYPVLDSTALVPSRGFGLGLGAHVYLFNVGASRLGVGLEVVNVRAITRPPEPEAPATGPAPQVPAGQQLQIDLRTVAPQVSFNFGSRAGWSYLSGGLGTADVITRTAGTAPGRRDSGRLNALNVGGGARWFLKSHLAFGFDVRMHRIAAGPARAAEQTAPGATPAPAVATPGMMILSVGVGLSVR
jgi:hypothetical protein